MPVGSETKDAVLGEIGAGMRKEAYTLVEEEPRIHINNFGVSFYLI